MRMALSLMVLLTALLAGCATNANSDPLMPTSTAIAETVPVAWVNELADEMTQGKRNTYYAIEEGSGVLFTLPHGFTKYHESKWFTRAVSADGVCITVTRQDNIKGATLDSWATLIKRTLAASRGLALRPARTVTLDNGEPAMLLDGVKQFSGMTMGYLVAVTVTERRVYVFEAWGPQESFDAAMSALETSIKSCDNSWWSDWLD